MSAYCVTMGNQGGVEVMATITDGSGAKEIAEAIAKAIAEAAPGQKVELWRGELGKEQRPHRTYRGEVEQVRRVTVKEITGVR